MRRANKLLLWVLTLALVITSSFTTVAGAQSGSVTATLRIEYAEATLLTPTEYTVDGQKTLADYGFDDIEDPGYVTPVSYTHLDVYKRQMEARGLDKPLRELRHRRVWLKSSGFLLIERTQAMTVIDVNTGKFTGKGDFEDTILRTNLEAAAEAARQLRLRDVGGMVVIDFIDMARESAQEQVLAALREAFAEDRNLSLIHL